MPERDTAALLAPVQRFQQEIEQNPLLEEEIPGSSTTEGDSSPEMDAQPEAGIEALVEKTTEVTLGENPSTLGEIDWSDYFNEYESGGAYKPRESPGEDQPSRFDILTAAITSLRVMISPLRLETRTSSPPRFRVTIW